MFNRAKVFSTVLAHVRASTAKYLVRSSVLVSAKKVPALKLLKPFTLVSASFVVLAASPSKRPLTRKELDQIVQNADNLFNENKFEETLRLLRPYKEDREEKIAWRISRAAYTLSKSKSISKPEQNALIEEAYDMAKLCLELNENSALAHKWMSIALDAYSGLQGFRTRCSTLSTVLNHMLKSVDLDPSDATVIYMVGMWYYSIADLAWYQKSVLQAIAGNIPSASFQEALIFFKRAEETSPNFYSLNLLMLGKCHNKLGDRETAIVYLQRAINYPKYTDDDHQAHQEASELLKKLQA